MDESKEKICPFHSSKERLEIYREYFVIQLELLKELIGLIDKEGRTNRLDNIDIILFSIISNGKAIVSLIGNGLIPEAYIIARSFLEKCVNFCYLNVCDESEYKNYIDWPAQKIIRSFYTTQKFFDNIGYDVPLPEFSSVIDNFEEVKKFSGKKGGEKPNWTSISIYQRIKFTEKKVDKFPCPVYLIALNNIYEYASESAHGTFYGIAYHTGKYNGRESEEDGYKHLIGLGYNLYMFLGLLVHGIFRVMSTKMNVDDLLKRAEVSLYKKIITYEDAHRDEASIGRLNRFKKKPAEENLGK